MDDLVDTLLFVSGYMDVVFNSFFWDVEAKYYLLLHFINFFYFHIFFPSTLLP